MVVSIESNPAPLLTSHPHQQPPMINPGWPRSNTRLTHSPISNLTLPTGKCPAAGLLAARDLQPGEQHGRDPAGQWQLPQDEPIEGGPEPAQDAAPDETLSGRWWQQAYGERLCTKKRPSLRIGALRLFVRVCVCGRLIGVFICGLGHGVVCWEVCHHKKRNGILGRVLTWQTRVKWPRRPSIMSDIKDWVRL